MPMRNDKLDMLITRIKYAESREWINSYFDLIKQVLEITNLENDDPRLAMSLSSNNSRQWQFPVSINNRYVVALRKRQENKKTKLAAFLIFDSRARKISELQDIERLQFRNLTGEYSEPPYLLRFEDLPKLLTSLEMSEQVYISWSEALLAEVKRAKASPYRRFHESTMYQMAIDTNFRSKILDTAFVSSKTDVDLLPEQIDESQEFYEGAIKTISVNAYERNVQARNACIEYYGVRCAVCGMTFQKRYGDIGKNFIHVHHIKPLGEIGAEYQVDPISDLRPVCPNCHAMLHMRKPPYTIKELKAMLGSK